MIRIKDLIGAFLFAWFIYLMFIMACAFDNQCAGAFM